MIVNMDSNPGTDDCGADVGVSVNVGVGIDVGLGLGVGGDVGITAFNASVFAFSAYDKALFAYVLALSKLVEARDVFAFFILLKIYFIPYDLYRIDIV